ncbi:penicillin-binding protein 2 [Candidatus Poribacteria bacterium]|nr:penicillin-binding protein 2 [Candidatus Poribacteria bacterium]MYA55063.1 penicillin-binding protein 2 [Candidatus Poribacteria bacterium]
MKNNSHLSIRRLVFVLIILQVGFLLLVGKLFNVQLSNDAIRQGPSGHPWGSTRTAAVKRGKILDRHGNVFALSRHSLSVYADPTYMKIDPIDAAQRLAPVLGVPESELLAKLRRKDKRFVWLKKDIDYELLDEIRAIEKDIRGIKHEVEQQRTYPKGKLAAQVIGHINDQNMGEGIEYQYNNYLLNARERQAARRAEAARNEPINLLTKGDSTDDYGYSVVLTLDEYIQYVAEKELAAACRKWNAPRGTAIVLASKTAEILALASYPTYDLNHYTLGSEQAKRNLGVWFAYEPGSIFKIIASSAVLNEGIMSPESTVFCENGRYRLPNGRIIRDVSGKGWLTLEEVLHKSSNIGMIKVVKELGHENLSTYIEKYGFGKATGVDLPYEHNGSLYAVKHWDTHSLGSVPFGQGIMVTPLQMVSALNVIANDGKLLRPHITREIRDSNGKVIEKKYAIDVRQVIRPTVAKQMAEILVGVVEDGSGRRARVEGYRVAGKTGTAQKAEKDGKGYAGKEIMSFMGFLPAENPMVSIIVMLDEPKGARFSGQIAGPLFQQIAAQTMQYLKQTEFFGPELQRLPDFSSVVTKQSPTLKGEGL